MSTERNLYCERLGLSIPRLDDVVGQKGVKLFHFMVVALLERGRPMGLGDLAGRLRAAGIVAASGDFALSLKKAWHGMEPVYRDAEGRFGLNLSSATLERILWTAGLGSLRAAASPTPPVPAQPADEIPLSESELDAAFRDRFISGFSALRQAAAVLDALGRPAMVEDVDAFLARLTRHREPLTAGRVRYWRSALVAMDEEGRLTLNRASPDLGTMRRAVRNLARPAYIQRARDAHWAQIRAEREAVLAQERREQAREASALRRAILRAVPEAENPQALALLDVGARSIRKIIGDAIAAVPDALSRFDLLAGLHIRETLHALRLDPDRWRLVDLRPPHKSRRINRAGRTLKITPELLIWSTTGIGRPLGDPDKMARYLGRGEVGKLARRLESDVKALYAFYRYGVLHRGVRLRWGFLDEVLGVDWALPGDPRLYDILDRARHDDTSVDIVTGAAPEWADPWARARRVEVVHIEPWVVTVRQGTEKVPIDRREIQAVRMVGVGDSDGP